MALTDVSKMITDRQQKCEYVEWFMRNHGEALAQALAEVLRPVLEEGETLPDTWVLIKALMRYLRGTLEGLVDSEISLIDGVSDEDLSRQDRDGLIAALRQAFIDARGMLRSGYGLKKALAAGFPLRVAQRALALLRQSLRVSRKLRAAGFDLGEPQYELNGGVTADVILSIFEPKAAALRAALDSVTKEKTMIAGTQVSKDQKMQEFDQVYGLFVSLLQAAFRMAGMPDLADRFRPTVPGRPTPSTEPVPDPAPDTPPPDPEPPTDEPLPEAQPLPAETDVRLLRGEQEKAAGKADPA